MLIILDNMKPYEVRKINKGKEIVILNTKNHLFCVTAFDPERPYIEPGGFRNLVPGYLPSCFDANLHRFRFLCSQYSADICERVWQTARISWVRNRHYEGDIYVTKWR